ncbi:glycosyltransferase family 1 protein [Leifsonia sp. ZF2019]|uniref:glycosyltransferase n=1 Tax=Leifsonia sp. ZF2019 TaxID=2781978 RepID=UPI001CC00184|nr:glycosyltransferase [Leifsonia sp. ZF2019]UAJ80220.1 glycosyltransferase family 1 protein [Leifsonia sp. ZF2019]
MAEVMFAVMPFSGHVAPMRAVVRAFAAAGHRVRVYTGSAHAEAFRADGAETVPWVRAPDFDENDPARTFPRLRGRKGPRQMIVNVEDLFVRTGAAQCADLTAAFDTRPWDVLVADSLSLGAHLAAERTGTPRVTVSLVPLATPSPGAPPPGLGLRPAASALGRLRDRALWAAISAASRPIQRAFHEQRALAGLPPTALTFQEALYSRDLVCASGVEQLEYPRPEWPGRIVWVGELADHAGNGIPEPAWWPESVADPRPLVHVTQGTQNVDPDDLIRPTFAALGRQQVQLAVATGVRGNSALPFPAPANARVADLLPYDRLLPRVDVMVTNGGWGGVLAALRHGVPLVIAGGDLDKPEVAARVAWSGAGVNLRTGTPSSRAILRAWRRISDGADYRAAAERIGAALRRHDGPGEVVEHTEALLAARR